MSKLIKMPNVGKILEKRLSHIGITNAEELIELGSKETFFRLHNFEGDTCFSTLCALEGAIQNMRWHKLSAEEKAELRQFFDEYGQKGN